MSMFSEILYRFRQFRLALCGPRVQVPDELLSPYLSQSMLTIFRRMLPSEQNHSYSVLQHLRSGGYENMDLLTAALLHDVGKVNSPLSVWDRSLIVIGKRFFPQSAKRWAMGEPHGFGRPFVVAACHPEWGAKLVEKAGARPKVVELVRRHQDVTSLYDPLLVALQEADNHE